MLHNFCEPYAESPMMPVIRISDATFVELKAVSTWLSTKTPSDTIERLVRDKLDELGLERDASGKTEASSPDSVLKFDRAPGLSFTRVLAARINGNPIERANWANVLTSIIAAVKGKGLSGEKLVTELQVPAKVRSYNEEGFRYYEDLGISLQGQSAQDAWKEVDRLARKWKISVQVDFQWRQNDKAQHPGRIGLLSI